MPGPFKHAISLALAVQLLLMSGCATYYQRNLAYQESVGAGQLEEAEKLLEKNKKAQKPKNRLLYLFNKGFIDQLQQEFVESNESFNEADRLIEDMRTNYQREALALITNPEARPYKPEDFESVLMHYYKAVNYAQLGRLDEARVEARRINLKLQQINNKYKKHRNRYTDDAFAHIMMGLTYDATAEYNDAFIAYRNAYELFQRDESGTYFGTPMPTQLKKDILRTAYLSGFQEKVREYEREFGMTYTHNPPEHGELVFFWHNGFGPVKAEWSINFAAVKGSGGLVTFVNEEYDLSFPFYLENNNEESSLSDLKVLRVAFPKYVERKPIYRNGKLKLNGETYPLEMAENVNKIAFQTLKDRFFREMATSLLRLAIKKAIEAKVSSENEALGALATITNAITEKADTRNWQTLPYAIHYTRIPLEDGENTVLFEASSANMGNTQQTFTFTGGKRRLQFFPYHSLATEPVVNAPRWFN